jgi:hypothetical protein
LGSAGRAVSLRVITLSFALQPRKKHGKTTGRVVEKRPDIPVAIVQYTFTHKQYTKHNETQNGPYITIRMNITIRILSRPKKSLHLLKPNVYFLVLRSSPLNPNQPVPYTNLYT